MHELLAILDTRTGSNFLREDQFVPFLKTKIVHVTETTWIPNANNKSMRIVGSAKLYVHVGRITKLIIFPICK